MNHVYSILRIPYVLYFKSYQHSVPTNICYISQNVEFTNAIPFAIKETLIVSLYQIQTSIFTLLHFILSFQMFLKIRVAQIFLLVVGMFIATQAVGRLCIQSVHKALFIKLVKQNKSSWLAFIPYLRMRSY